ncbi:MAG: OB-fold nucleic acid binding domain-containing protein, partial [Phycisphaerae bacterium]
VARLVNQLGGIERKRAFRLAKAISKKKTSLIEAEREPFIAGAAHHGVKNGVAEEIFNQIIPFGEYAFNKAHSTGYALVAFQTAYVKAHYPLEFMAAVLTYDMGDTDKIVGYREECARLGIDVKPPDINTSNVDFTTVAPEGGNKGYLRFGLAAIKGLGEKAVQHIVDAREQGEPFTDLYDFCERIDPTAVNRGVCEALIKAGAFDSTGAMRKALIGVLDEALRAGADAQRDRDSGQMTMFGEFGHEAAAPSRRKLSAEEWSESEMLAHEKSVLGFYVTSHPLWAHETTLKKYATAGCADLDALPEGGPVVLGGMISRLRTVTTKSGRNAGSKLAILTFEDLTGSIEAVVFSEELETYRGLVRPDGIVFLRGVVDRRREDPSLRVSEIIPIEEGPARMAEAMIIKVSVSGLESMTLRRLREICTAHPGERPFFIKVQKPGEMTTLIRCDHQLRVRPDADFIRDVESLLGQRSVDLVGARRVAEAGPGRSDQRDA